MNMSQVTIDILNNPRFEGAISSIEWLTDYIDVGFGMAITLVAFLIILVAMFKNVLAAAYCAYPKFWNKVNDAHTKNKDAGIIKQIQEAANGMKGGTQSVTVGEIIMGVLPDIKAMTDFEADTLSPKTYFMKAIPQMIVCVIIGAFIYNGYYRDVTSKVVDVGSTLLQRTLLECDPVAMYDQFTGSAGRPVFASDDSVDGFGRMQNKIATSLYTSIIGTYTDINSADAKRVLADACDTQAKNIATAMQNGGGVSGDEDFTDDAKWKLTMDTVWSSSNVDLTGKSGFKTNKDGSRLMQYASIVVLDSMGIPSSQSHPQNGYIVVKLVMEEQNVTTGATSYNDLIMCINSNGTIQLPGNKTGEVEWVKTPATFTINGVTFGMPEANKYALSKGSTGDLTTDQVYTLDKTFQFKTFDANGVATTHTITQVRWGGTTGDLYRDGSTFVVFGKGYGPDASDKMVKFDDAKGLGVSSAPTP